MKIMKIIRIVKRLMQYCKYKQAENKKLWHCFPWPNKTIYTFEIMHFVLVQPVNK